MTREFYSGPGTETYRSTRFAVSHDESGEIPYVYGVTQEVPYNVGSVFVFGDNYQMSFMTYGSDAGSTTLSVTLVSGTITSAKVYPRRKMDDRWSIAGGVLTISVPDNASVWIEVNGDRSEPLFIFAKDIRPSVDARFGSHVTYNGTQTSAATGQTLYFGPGVHDLVGAGAWNDKLFPVASGADVYLHPDAWVIGSFDIRGLIGMTIRGHGTMSGEWLSPAAFHALALTSFNDQLEYSMLCGYDLTFPLTGNNSVKGITIVNPPFYCTTNGVNEWDEVCLIAPWYYNCNGFSYSPNYLVAGGPASIDRSFAYCGDDALVLETPYGTFTGDDNFIVGVGSAALLIDYNGRPKSQQYPTTLTNFYSLGIPDYYSVATPSPGVEGGAVVQCWVDTPDTHPDWGMFYVEIDGIYVDGPCTCPVFNIKNRLYPWGATNDAEGIIGNLTFRNVVVEEVPTEMSILQGLNTRSQPQDIIFDNMTIGGEQVSARNFTDFFTVNSYLSRIWFSGRLMTTAVDICNMALGLIGNKAKVTAIDPPDGSMEADHCARLYPQALRAVLEMHNWSFAKRKVALTVVNADSDDTDDPAWLYRYQLPADWVKVISILPDGTTNDYLVGGVKQPVDHDIKYSEDDEQQRLYTNEETAWMRYIYYEDDPNQWSHLFTQAVVWHLASMLAGPIIKGDQGHSEAQRCLQRMSQYLGEARVKDSNERQATVERKASWIRGR